MLEEIETTPGEQLILKLQCRLFNLITMAPGVPRYASDVEVFTEARFAAGLLTRDEAIDIISSNGR